MPKYRNLHVKIIESFDFIEMPDDFTRVTWMLLTLVVDSEGRGIDNAAWLHAKMYPMRPDVSDLAIKRVFDWLATRGMIVRYKASGRQYFYVPSFKNYQSHLEREARSILPPPPELTSDSRPNQEEVTTGSNTSVIVDVIEIEGVLTPGEIDEESAIGKLSRQFEASANMTVRNVERWTEALQEMYRAGVTPEDLAHVIHTMKCPPKGGKKLMVSGPWSCVNPAIAYVADKPSTGTLGINREDYEQ